MDETASSIPARCYITEQWSATGGRMLSCSTHGVAWYDRAVGPLPASCPKAEYEEEDA